jgi:hypothetical protein
MIFLDEIRGCQSSATVSEPKATSSRAKAGAQFLGAVSLRLMRGLVSGEDQSDIRGQDSYPRTQTARSGSAPPAGVGLHLLGAELMARNLDFAMSQ